MTNQNMRRALAAGRRARAVAARAFRRWALRRLRATLAWLHERALASRRSSRSRRQRAGGVWPGTGPRT